MRLGVLASGTGTILTSLIDANLPIAVVVVDRPCSAQQIAAEAGIATELVERTVFDASFDRHAYSEQLVQALAPHRLDVLAMAGFGTIVSEKVHQAYPLRILNTHPALLPAFKGWHAVRDALSAGVKISGCTVHVATIDVDEGPILAQEAVPVLDDDTEESLHERIKEVERRLYPATVRVFLEQLSTTDKGELLA